jgi:Protein of unknown function DUF262
MGLFEDTCQRDLKTLLTQIHTRETALPDFQRDFVWDPWMTQELIVSIAHDHAAGSLWRIRNTQKLFAWREFQGAPAFEGSQPMYLVLDGQQRLTSLYRAFYGVGAHRYYINLHDLLQGADFEDFLFHLRAHTRRAQAYESFDVQAQTLVLPLTVLRDGIGTFSRWRRQVIRLRSGDGERDTLEDALSDVEEHWIRPIDAYQFPVITLSETTSLAAVCRMFEKLNGTGVKLGPFELLTARFWPKESSLRHFHHIIDGY